MSGNGKPIVLGQTGGLSQMSDCGCCEGTSVKTPVEISNRPGLAAILYRTGTHARFKQSMLARLSASDHAPLKPLTTREDDDPAIALLDCWATIADILTFYQERIANESFLRTATERRSVLELARLIGYQLSPGVAADAYLAFTIEDSPGSVPQTSIQAGAQVQSVPGPGQQAQVFETSENIEVHAEWSAIKPLMSQPQPTSESMCFALFAGTATKLKVGDQLIVSDLPNGLPTKLLNVTKITPDTVAKTTRADFSIDQAPMPDFLRPGAEDDGSTNDFADNAPLDADAIQLILKKNWDAATLVNIAASHGWSLDSLAASIEESVEQVPAQSGPGVYVFRQRAALFGYNFPEQITYSRLSMSQSEWPKSESPCRIYLDTVYDGILANSCIAVQYPPKGTASFFLIADTKASIRSAYGQTARSTAIDLNDGETWWPSPVPGDFGGFRSITICAQSELLALAWLPILTDIQGDVVTLDGCYLGLKIGQKVVVAGQRSDLAGVTASELLTLKEVTLESGYTVLTFKEALANTYVRSSVTINANVASATHGQTVKEILGSGNGTQVYQTFTLAQSPLTYVHDTSPSGAASTLQLRVNDLLWHEVPTLLGSGPTDRVYVTQRSDEGKTTVEFGDGNTGAKLPTGVENVQAVYRKGIGLAGLVGAGRISQLLSRPLGVKAVTNPLDATDAIDPETLDSARGNAPLKVLTLDRVVSLEDYENYARTHGAIVKALATWAWIGRRRTVLLTVAGTEGAVVSDCAISDLIKSLHQWGDPFTAVQAASFRSAQFAVSGSVYVQPDFNPPDVLGAVRAALLSAFSFEARAFTQPVAQSEVIAVIQAVPGVLAVDLDAFYRVGKKQKLKDRVIAHQPALDSAGKLIAGEMLTIDPQSLVKVQVAA